jgi:hypothetical protein
LPLISSLELVSKNPGALSVERSDCGGNQWHAAAATRGLRVAEPTRLARNCDKLSANVHSPLVELDGRPFQAKRLANAQTRREHYGEQLLEFVSLCGAEEHLGFVRCQWRRLLLHAAGSIDQRHDVALDNLPFRCSS